MGSGGEEVTRMVNERGHEARDELINMRDDTHTHVVVVVLMMDERSSNWQGLE
jgi:hypothetical protein